MVKQGTAKWQQARIQQYNKQGGVCAICRNKLQSLTYARKAHLDHCHETGKLGGVLCQQCNLGLGAFKDDPVLLSRAINYLYLYR